MEKQKVRKERERKLGMEEVDEDDCEKSTLLNRIPNFCSFDPQYPKYTNDLMTVSSRELKPFSFYSHRELMLQAWDGEKIDQMLKEMKEQETKKNGMSGLEEEVVNREFRSEEKESAGRRNDSLVASECQSLVEKTYPQKARNTNGSWRVIVNLENKLMQEITVSSCK